jgi:rhodanese-related sulfurtransferase/DNA-binding transcriptional ArsR family regulator
MLQDPALDGLDQSTYYSIDPLNTKTQTPTVSTSPKRDVFANLARVGTAVSNATRIELLELLAQTERSVDELATLTGTTIANTSQHLQKLRQAGLIVGRKQGLYVFYRLAGDQVVEMLSAISRVGEAYVAEVERIVRLYFAHKDELEPVPAKELLERARKGLVTVLDVRPNEEFAAGHVPGAINIPVHELEKRLKDLPKRKEVIAYCRGPYCLMSYDAVSLLRKRGLKARRLEAGMPEWRAAGLPVDRH